MGLVLVSFPVDKIDLLIILIINVAPLQKAGIR